MRSTTTVLLAGLATIAACAAPAEPEPTANDTRRQAPDVAARSNDSTYFLVTRPDYRKCMYPMCGGTFVAAVNHEETTCFGGEPAADCYASEIDWSALGLDPSLESEIIAQAQQGQVLLRGNLVAHSEDFPQISKLTLDGAWAGQTANTPVGNFYQVVNSGIVCITYPCPVMQALTLNHDAGATMAGIELTAAGASAEVVDAASQLLQTQGLMVAATTHTVSGPGGTLGGLTATEIYFPVGLDAGGEPCGSNICGAGEYCCNASCSMCVPEGNMCTQQACEPVSCSHDVCAAGEALEPACSSCATTVCAADPYCCDQAWDSICVNEAKQMCAECAAPEPEPSCSHDVCSPGAALVDGCSPCASTVCAQDPFCCNNAWDALCAQEAEQLCAECEPAPPEPTCAHDPCSAGAELSADCSPCATAVCDLDAYCCDVAWDSICVGEAAQLCGCS